MKKIKIKYFSEDYPKLEKIKQGDWIDLGIDGIEIDAVKNINGWTDEEEQDIINTWQNDSCLSYEKGDVLFLKLGVAMELPTGYEAYVLPRSSTFKKTGLILTNGNGI